MLGLHRSLCGHANFVEVTLFASHASGSHMLNCSPFIFFRVFCGKPIHPTPKVSEEVNRKLPVRNTTVHLLTVYTDPGCHNAQRNRGTDITSGQRDDIIVPIADR